jgi:hypothetical protein
MSGHSLFKIEMVSSKNKSLIRKMAFVIKFMKSCALKYLKPDIEVHVFQNRDFIFDISA